MKRWFLVVFVVVASLVVLVGGGAAMLVGPIWMMGRHIKQLNALLSKPENYRPAAVALARLCETDPTLLKSDQSGLPPDWIPPELGKLGPLEIMVQSDMAALSTTSGLAEFNGYRLDSDRDGCTEATSAWTLTFDGIPPMGDTPEFRFSIPKNDGYSEVELVQNALVELSRRKAAQASKTDASLFDFDKPDDDRQRLLAQHHAVARQLGLVRDDITATSTSQPTRQAVAH